MATPSRKQFLQYSAGALLAAIGGTGFIRLLLGHDDQGVAGAPLGNILTANESASSVIPSAAAIRIDDVTVVDPRDGSARSGMSVLVRQGKIASVTSTADGVAAMDVSVIHGENRFLIPGYNNMHTHVLQQDRSQLYMATMLAEGTTGMRLMGGSDQLLRYRAQDHLSLGVMTPALLAMPGAVLNSLNSPSIERVRWEIRRQRNLGVDFIKYIQTDRAVMFAAIEAAHENGLKIGGHLPPTVSPAEASEAGFDFIEHLGTSSNIWIETSSERAALRAREDTSGTIPDWLGYVPFAQQLSESAFVTQASNGVLLNPALSNPSKGVVLMRQALDSFDEAAADELVAAFVRNRTWQTPTLARLRTEYRADDAEYRNHPWLKMMSASARRDFEQMRQKFLNLPEATRATYHDYYDASVKMVKKMYDAGVPIMAGTDGPTGIPGEDLQTEFRELAAAGIPPLGVLQSATTVPASFLGRSDRMGAVAAGMEANLLLLDADPLKAVANLGRISGVVRAGHYMTGQDISRAVKDLLDRAKAA